MKVQLMFRTLLIIMVAVIAFSVSSFAQNIKQIENLKIAYITKQLDLSEEQAQKFWPVYNKHESQLRNLYAKFKEEDSSAEEMMNIETDILNVKKKKINALKDILSKEQINKLIKAEKKFVQKILDELKQKR